MIRGIGTDLVQVVRIERALARTPRLAQRILTDTEYAQFNQATDPARFLAKRFAAKEAAVKALGTGIGRGVSWQHLCVVKDDWGKPGLELSGGAKARADQLGAARLHLSYSDERDYLVAFVIAE